MIKGNSAQIILQLIDMVTVVAWTGVTAFICFWVIKKTIGLRAPKEEELAGLDVPEHGLEAYPADSPRLGAGAAD